MNTRGRPLCVQQPFYRLWLDFNGCRGILAFGKIMGLPLTFFRGKINFLSANFNGHVLLCTTMYNFIEPLF